VDQVLISHRKNNRGPSLNACARTHQGTLRHTESRY
jgi:hypothetical protein